MRNQTTKFTLILGAATMLAAATALADSLVLIPAVGTDTTTGARGITPDGAFVGGVSGTRGFLYGVAANTTWQVSGYDAPSSINGIAYRYDGTVKQIILQGKDTASDLADYMTVASTPGTFSTAKRRDSVLGTPVNGAGFNALAGTAGSDYYSTTVKSGSSAVYVGKMTGAWGGTANSVTAAFGTVTSGSTFQANGISSTGRAVGKSVVGGATSITAWDYNGTAAPTAFNWTGLDGTDIKGIASAVSADGLTIFGQSPLGTGVNYGYKATFSGTTRTSIGQLPLVAGTAGSVSLAYVYGTTVVDGKFAVGMDYQGTEKAAIWDTQSSNPSLWVVKDLTALATTDGILGGFTRLFRAYSVGEDGLGNLVITGDGVYGTSATTRAFVMTIPISEVPEPGTLTLLGLGLFGLLALRRSK